MMETISSQIAHTFTAFNRGRILSISVVGLVLLAGCSNQPATQAAPPAATPQTSTTADQQAPPASNLQSASTARPAGVAPAAPMRAMEGTPAATARAYTIPSGTAITIRTNSELSAKNNNLGDPFEGTLVNSLSSNGKVLIRAGAPVSGVVVASKGQGRFKGEGAFGVQLKTIGSRPVSTTSYLKSAGGKGKRSGAMIGGGAGGGALIGGLAGGGKGAVIGGLLGAGAGSAGAALTGNKNISIPAESTITFTLTAPMRVTSKVGAAAASE